MNGNIFLGWDTGRGGETMQSTSLAKLERNCSKNPTSILFARFADEMLRSGNVDRATEICRKGLRYRPFYPTGHLVMGRCHIAAGRLEEAREAFHDTLALDHDNPAAYWLLGKIERRMGFEEQALQFFGCARTVDPLSRVLVSEMGDVAQAEDEPASESGSGDKPEPPASDETSSIDDARAEPKDISLLLRDLPDQRSLGKDAAAISESDSGIAPIATSTLAELYVAQGLIEEAVAVLAQVCEREPENEPLKKRLNEIQHMDGMCAEG